MSLGAYLPVVSGKLDTIVRRVLPSVPVLSHQRWLMWPLDVIDWCVSKPLGVSGSMPPNRFRIRVGAGNRILFNQIPFRWQPVSFWVDALATGFITLDSNILDVGCGCGRYALTMRDLGFQKTRFRGMYTGIDIDRQMIDWCRANFPKRFFRFESVDEFSLIYNPTGDRQSTAAYPVEDDSQDMVFALSVLTHLLEDSTGDHLREAHRVLKPGAWMQMSVFSIDHMRDHLDGRWTFQHRMGAAYVESVKYPEAAVAYDEAWLLERCEEIGFAESFVMGSKGQSMLRARK